MLADSPVAYYRLDETAGPTMCDSSTSANNGTYSATGITYGAAGALVSGDTAVSSDGTPTMVGQSTADPTGLTGNHAFTLEAWFKSATTRPPTNANTWLVGIGGTGGTGQADVLSLNPNHSSQLGWGPTSSFGIDQYGSDYAWDPGTDNLWDDNWHYIAVTYTPSTTATATAWVGYLDGQNLGNPDPRPYGNAVTNIAASPILLGNGCTTNSCYWKPLDGSLDEVAVYPTALSSARIAAHYAAASQTLQSLTVTRTGQGTVASSPAGIDCGPRASQCAAQFVAGTEVTLTASPSSDWKFGGWSGAGCSGTGSCKVTIEGPQAVHATFRAIGPPNTSVTKIHLSSAKHEATFSFTGKGGVGKLRFQCRLDSGHWESCASPKTYDVVSGRHKFSVRAIDSRGAVDPTPATANFKM